MIRISQKKLKGFSSVYHKKTQPKPRLSAAPGNHVPSDAFSSTLFNLQGAKITKTRRTILTSTQHGRPFCVKADLVCLNNITCPTPPVNDFFMIFSTIFLCKLYKSFTYPLYFQIFPVFSLQISSFFPLPLF